MKVETIEFTAQLQLPTLEIPPIKAPTPTLMGFWVGPTFYLINIIPPTGSMMLCIMTRQVFYYKFYY